MALPTPPNSSKEPLHHTFCGDETPSPAPKSQPAYWPLFDRASSNNNNNITTAAAQDGPPSPTARLYGSRFSTSNSYFSHHPHNMQHSHSPAPISAGLQPALLQPLALPPAQHQQQPQQQGRQVPIVMPPSSPKKRLRPTQEDDDDDDDHRSDEMIIRESSLVVPAALPSSNKGNKRHRIDSFDVAMLDEEADPTLFASDTISDYHNDDDEDENDAEEFSARAIMTLSDLQLSQGLHPRSPIYHNILRVCLNHPDLSDRIRRVRGVSPPTINEVRTLMDLKQSAKKQSQSQTTMTLTTPTTSKKLPSLSQNRTAALKKSKTAPKTATAKATPTKKSAAKTIASKQHEQDRHATPAPGIKQQQQQQQSQQSQQQQRRTSSTTTTSRQRRAPQSQTPQSKGEIKTTRNPANKPAVSKVLDDWPDYCPAGSVLDGARAIADAFPRQGGRDLKDYSQYEHYDKLHSVEITITQQASVDPSRYLVTKRSVFVGYLKYLLAKKGKRALSASEETSKGLKSWNKTAAQNCSSIDVNKTSALFEHFWMKAGLFDERHFQRYIDNPELALFPEFDKEGNLIRQAN